MCPCVPAQTCEEIKSRKYCVYLMTNIGTVVLPHPNEQQQPIICSCLESLQTSLVMAKVLVLGVFQ